MDRPLQLLKMGGLWGAPSLQMAELLCLSRNNCGGCWLQGGVGLLVVPHLSHT